MGGKKYTVVSWMTTQKAPSGISYKVVGYINDQNLVEKVETWLENPIFGDMLVEALYTEYRDANGLKYPATIVQKRGGSATFEAQILGVNANQEHRAVGDASCRRSAGPAAGAAAGEAAAPTSEKLRTASIATTAHNAMAIEFKDHIVLFEVDRRRRRDRWRSSRKREGHTQQADPHRS
jgi:hypothetical protein